MHRGNTGSRKSFVCGSPVRLVKTTSRPHLPSLPPTTIKRRKTQSGVSVRLKQRNYRSRRSDEVRENPSGLSQSVRSPTDGQDSTYCTKWYNVEHHRQRFIQASAAERAVP
jgi:hypothetical protein